MKFFKKIFTSGESQKSFVDRRQHEQFPISIEFPLIVESHGTLLEPTTISLGGIGFFSPKDFQSELIVVNFILEQKELALVSEVRYKTSRNKIHYGVEFKYRNEAQKKDYCQMILPIILGNSFREGEDEKVDSISPIGLRRTFKSNQDATIHIYYLEGGSALEPLYFEFLFENYLLVGNLSEKNIKVYDRKTKQLVFVTPVPLIRESRNFTEIEDMILLFRWTVLNLSKKIPSDVHQHLESFL